MLRNLIQIILLVGKSSEQTARIRSVRIFQFAVHGIQTAKKDRGGKDEIVEIGWSKSVSSRKVGGMPEVGMAKVSNRGARYFKVSCRGRGRKTKTKKVAHELVHRGMTVVLVNEKINCLRLFIKSIVLRPTKRNLLLPVIRSPSVK